MEQQYNIRSPAVKRLMREAKELSESTSEYFAQPLSDNLFEWHFTVRGPADSEFEGGVYHGRILLPPDYPMKPPNIIILTPNGRFETGKKICLSISGHHPESWQPSWSIRTALLAIIGFMPTPGHGTIGALDYKPDERKRLAKKSVTFCCDECCGGGQPVAMLLKTPEANSSALSAAEEAKEIIKSMTMKGEDDTQRSEAEVSAKPEAIETPAEKERRERKEASKRAQDRFKARLHARTPNVVAQMVSLPPFQPTPAATVAAPTTSGASTSGTTSENQNPVRAVRRPAEQIGAAANENWFSTYDWLIALIVLTIAALVYRRFGGADLDHEGQKLS